jgi:hypothetical protein
MKFLWIFELENDFKKKKKELIAPGPKPAWGFGSQGLMDSFHQYSKQTLYFYSPPKILDTEDQKISTEFHP